MKEVKGRVAFYQLKIDGRCAVTDFENNISSNDTYFSEKNTILSYMDFYSQNPNKKLPHTKFKILSNDKFTAFEFKTKHLRYYGFFYKGAVICLAEMNDKSEQGLHIKKLEKLIKECEDSIKKLIE